MRDSRRAVHFSTVLEDFLEVLRRLIREGMGWDERMVQRVFGVVDRL